MIRSIAILAGSLAVLALAGCGKEGVVFQKPPLEVHRVLAQQDQLPPVFGSREPDLRMEASDPSKVAWVLVERGSEVMRFVATLEPEEANSTRVTVSLLAPTQSAYGNMDQRLKEHPEIKQLYLVAMNEQIASGLENRPFDGTKLFGAVINAGARNAGKIARDMDAVAEAANKHDEANIRKAYAEEAAGR